MDTAPRLAFASVWGFETTGIQELENEFKKTGSVVDCQGDYDRRDDVLLLKGGLQGSLSEAAGILSQFIEEQESKDLLDDPRIYRLEVPAILQDEPISALDPATHAQGDLLALGPPQDEELIPHSRVTKTWVSPDGGAGCFSAQFRDILSEIAKLTGTEIAVSEDLRGVQVTGRNENDVNDALAKITRVHKPLMCACNPFVMNMGMSPEDKSTRLQLRYYSNLNLAAKRRILAAPNLSSTSALYQSFVTVTLAFDEEWQVYRLPDNFLNPPKIGDGPGGESRIWSDFTFQEFGKGDQFTVAEIVDVETTHSDAKSSPVEEPPTHRYLSAAKAMQVDKWVNERTEIEQTEPAPLLSSMPQPEASCEPTPATNTVKPPGIKSRRVVASVQKQSTSPAKSTTSQGQPLNASGDDKTKSPRKKWKMNYEINHGQSASHGIGPGPGQPNKEIDKREGGALCDVSSNFADPKVSEGKAGLPSNPNTTKYVKNKPIRIPTTNPRDNHRPRAYENSSSWSNRKPRRVSELIDTSVPACTANANALPRLFLDQPALIPEKPTTSSNPEHTDNTPIPCEGNNSTDLAGLSFETDGSWSPGPNSVPSSQEAASGSTDTLEQEKRLDQLKKTLLGQVEIDHINEVDGFTAHKPRSRRHANQVYRKDKLEELDRIRRPEMTQSTDEVATRQYHLTMNQKTAKSNGKMKGKAEVKAKRQATLEDAWGFLRKPTKKTGGSLGIEKASSKPEKGGKFFDANFEQLQPQRLQKDESDIKQLFKALKEALEAAEYFPGTVTLELQFGLLLIPLLPKTHQEKSMSLDEWARIFQPQTGITPPTTKFISRLTTSGSDVDHIVDLKMSKAEGKGRIFEQEDSEYCVFYEYHCRTKSDKLFIVTVNDQGKHTLKYPTNALGGVNLHFPEHTWDARLGLSGGFTYREGSDPELEEAVQYLVDHIWVPPKQTLVQIYTKVPKGNIIAIDKVLMKRWTRHQYIRTDDTVPKDVTNLRPAASTGAQARSATNPDPADTTTRNYRNSAASPNVDQELVLQVTEVQDLVIGTCDKNAQIRRAQCESLLNMLKDGRQWYEVSLVSPAIEAILKANANLELGERTDDWRATDLFGNDASLLYDKPTISTEACAPVAPGPVAAAIGDSGIGHLLRLAKKIIGRMDGVGYWNYNPHADADTVRMPPASSFSIPPALTVASLKKLADKPEPKSLSFEELESIKDVGSATMGVAVVTKKSSPIPSMTPPEQIVYW